MSKLRKMVLKSKGKFPIPFSNNLELDPEDQVCIHFHYLSKKEMEEAKAEIQMQAVVDDNKNVQIKESSKTYKSAVAKKAFDSIDSFVVEQDGKDIEIDSYKKLATTAGLENILVDFENWFLKQEAFDEKKSESVST